MDFSETSYGQAFWSGKVLTAEQAAHIVKPGDSVFLGTACATPRRLVAALESLSPPPADVEFFHFLTDNAVALKDGKPVTNFRHRCFFVGSEMRGLVNKGMADYVPISLNEVPRLIETGRIVADVAFIQVTPPDDQGYVSLGISVDITSAIARRARMVIAEINPNMPRTLGDTFIHVDQIDHLVWVDDPIQEYRHETSDDIAERVAKYIAGIIEDGSTLQIGLGRIPNVAMKFLHDRRNLGIHSDVITDCILELVESGIINGSQKTLYPGQIVTSYCLGTRKMYDLIADNPLFVFKPIEYVSDPVTIAKNDKMVSITQAYAVDLTGQVCSDQFQGEFYSGVSTQPDFMRGAALSKNGKPIICLSSTTFDGKTSRIRALLQMGEGVGVARSNVHYVVTEFGIAYLYGKSIRERALALIEIAHPDFREDLLATAKLLGYVPPEQRIESHGSYLIDEERTVTLKGERTVMIRPARAADAHAIQHLIHEMSIEDVYTRFFRRLKGLTYDEAQRMCSVNYDTEVAFVATTGPRENDQIVGSCCYFLNPTTNFAEVAFMITPEWQGSGLGQALQQRMMEFAKDHGVRGFTAEVLARNGKMIGLANKCCDSVTVQRIEDTYHITMKFSDDTPSRLTAKG
jgi:acyl-CoA hydrolase/N-acetylglutamate synthase-like GNAT family acetyltransferase